MLSGKHWLKKKRIHKCCVHSHSSINMTFPRLLSSLNTENFPSPLTFMAAPRRCYGVATVHFSAYWCIKPTHPWTKQSQFFLLTTANYRKSTKIGVIFMERHWKIRHKGHVLYHLSCNLFVLYKFVPIPTDPFSLMFSLILIYISKAL